MKTAEREPYELLDQHGSEVDRTKKSTPAAPRATVRIDERSLWRMLLPVADNDGIVFSEHHHNVVRQKVRKKSGGLTDNLAAHGEWINNEKKLVNDRNIPIDFLATCGQADKIAAFAREHYRQTEIMYYVISSHVRKATAGDSIESRIQEKEAELAKLKQELAAQTIRLISEVSGHATNV
jgi:hypothetical protein